MRHIHGIDVTIADWPLVVVRFPPEITVEAYEALYEYYVDLCGRGQRIGWLIDFQNYDPVRAPARLRRDCAEVVQRNLHHLIPVTVCEGRVVQSMMSRGILTAFDWLTGSKWPVNNVSSFEEAESWCWEQLDRSTRRAPPQGPSVSL